MLEHEVKSKVLTIGNRKGQTAYYAYPKSQQKLTKLGMGADLAELGSFRIVVPSKMMNSAAEVTVKDALKAPKIVFTPKQKMRDAANQVELSIDRGTSAASGEPTTPGGGEEDDNQSGNPL